MKPSSTSARPAPPVQWNPALLVLSFGFIVCLFMAQIEFGRHETVGEVHGVLTADGGVSTKLDTILSTQAQLEVIATEFQAVRGMAWVPNEETAGYLLFADGKERGKVYRHRISQGIVPFDSISVYDSRSSSNGIALEQRSKLLVSDGAQPAAMRVASARMRALLYVEGCNATNWFCVLCNKDTTYTVAWTAVACERRPSSCLMYPSCVLHSYCWCPIVLLTYMFALPPDPPLRFSSYATKPLVSLLAWRRAATAQR